MVFFELVFDAVLNIISSLGYGGVLILMAMESMVFPVPSEAVMPFAGYLAATGEMNFALVIIASTIGSIVGSLISYYMGFRGEKFVEKHGRLFLLKKNHLEETEKFFKKHGEKAIFVARFIPVVRHLVSIPAGLGRMDIKKFVLYTAIGAGAWNFILAYSGLLLNKNWNVIISYSQYIDIAVIAGIVVFALWFVRRRKAYSEPIK